MSRVLIGSWRCPSGNSCDVSLDPRPVFPEQGVFVAWDVAPPDWTPDDAAHYASMIRPDIQRCVVENLELIGPTTWVEILGPVIAVTV